MFEVGAAVKEITVFKPKIGMMGYGMSFNTIHDIETPLLARAFFFHHKESGKNTAIVVADMCFISISVKQGVCKKLARKHPELKLTEENLMLTAQHTHSGPGGYSHYGLYNITIPGFVPEVYQFITEKITEAIVEAAENSSPADLFLDSDEFPAEIPVAFNRSMKAYLSNPEVKGLDKKDTHLAVDREMHLLRIEGKDGKKIGAINWFGVHTTSVHNDNHSICWDNKGYAARMMENDIRCNENGEGFIGAFGQGPAGDVSPNYIWDKKKKWTRGAYENDFESAKHNGRLQYEMAKRIYDNALTGHQITGNIDWVHTYVNFANVLSKPEFANGNKSARTGPACHGLSFFAGTVEGPGMSPVIKYVTKGLTKIVKAYEYVAMPLMKRDRRRMVAQKYRVHGKKDIVVETGERRVLGTSHVKKLIVPSFADDTIRYFKTLHPKGWHEDKPWVPHIVPLQIVILGDIAFVAIAGEPTTMAAQRIRKMIEDQLLPKGIHKVLILPYANAYHGYITTYEEYQHQLYEGGHTVYGEWTLAAYQTRFSSLCKQLVKKVDNREILSDGRPPDFSNDELLKRSHDKVAK